jgi:hypothetical protein
MLPSKILNIRLEIDSAAVRREVQIRNEMERYYQTLLRKELNVMYYDENKL